MKKVILIPDSFKGTITAEEFCNIASRVTEKYFPSREILSLPLADGGEGTTDCFLSQIGYEKIDSVAINAFMKEKPVYYAKKGDTAIVEMAMCASLPSVRGNENPSITTTFGVGQLIKHAVLNGAKRVIIGLGGSCTNDGGCGMATALGVKFYNYNGCEFIPVGGTLKNIEKIDITPAMDFLKDIEIIAMCDIDNPLYGENGAAFIFSPQKGADEKMVQELDVGLKHLSEVSYKLLGKDYHTLKGAGAAGGMGFGVVAFLGGKLMSGIDLILNTIKFDSEVETADIVITGEGKIDSQSLSGKSVIGIARRAKKYNVPVVAIVGSAEDGFEKAYNQGLTAVFSTNFGPQTYEQACRNAHKNLEKILDNVFRLIKSIKS